MGKSKKLNNLGHLLDQKSIKSLLQYGVEHHKGSRGFVKTLRQYSTIALDYMEPVATIKQSDYIISNKKKSPVSSVQNRECQINCTKKESSDLSTVMTLNLSKNVEIVSSDLNFTDFNEIESSFEIAPKEKPVEEISTKLSNRKSNRVIYFAQILPSIPAQLGIELTLSERILLNLDNTRIEQFENYSTEIICISEEHFSHIFLLNERFNNNQFDFFQNHSQLCFFCERSGQIAKGIPVPQRQLRKIPIIYASQKERPET